MNHTPHNHPNTPEEALQAPEVIRVQIGAITPPTGRGRLNTPLNPRPNPWKPPIINKARSCGITGHQDTCQCHPQI